MTQLFNCKKCEWYMVVGLDTMKGIHADIIRETYEGHPMRTRNGEGCGEGSVVWVSLPDE